MGLTRRQEEAVNRIIREEVEGAFAVQKLRDRSLRSGRLLEESLFNEAGPDPKRVDKAMLSNAIEHDEDLFYLAQELAGETVGRFTREMGPMLIKLLEKHAMDVTNKGHQMTPGWTPQSIEELEETNESIEDAQMECVTDVAGAFHKLIEAYLHAAAEETAKAREEY